MPKPPADMWEILDRERMRGDSPGNSFTRNEFAAKFNIPYSTAAAQIAFLIRRGVVVPVGQWGPGHQRFYTIVTEMVEQENIK